MYKRLANNRSLNDKNYALGRVNSNKPILMLSKKHLQHTFNELRSNGKTSSSPDGISFSSLTEREWEIRISKLAKSIKNDTYKPGTTKPVNIDKPCGGFRTIRISNHTDKIVQRACLEILTPIIDPTFVDWSYGFRPKCNHNQILVKLAEDYSNGLIYVCHIDIKKAFDSVRIQSISKMLNNYNLTDNVLMLTKTLLLGTDPHRLVGLNQGEALSGILFNLFMHNKHDSKISTLSNTMKIYRYADDICIIGSSKELVENAVQESTTLITKAGLSFEKSNLISLNDDKIELLGLTLKGNGNSIEYSLPESSWTRLSLSLDEAHNHPNPISQIQMIVSGWKQALHPKILTVQEVRRLEGIIRNHGINMNNLIITNQE